MLMDLLFPAKCLGCNSVLQPGEYLCQRCKKQIHYVGKNVCVKCGKPLIKTEADRCYDCQKQQHYFKMNRSVMVYDAGVKKMLYELKYNHRKEVAAFLGKEMARELKDYIWGLKIQGIVPIPLHGSKKRERGYNQAELIAAAMGKETGIRVYGNYLIRSEDTRPQKELNDMERKNNVKNAFHMGQNEVQLKRIMLVDDIYTTGATLDAATRALQKKGEVEVYGVTTCIGRGY